MKNEETLTQEELAEELFGVYNDCEYAPKQKNAIEDNEILTAIKNDKLYDFIANNYWKMSNEQLKDIILELYYIYRCETIEQTKENIKQCNEQIADYLIDNKDWEA